ncbi:hypothetical protein PR048_029177 [Dryococelus australis]|uniref:Uncharacterized protein n=1 Tax=Dryococelus australis TaxID=614101 RepID=A0ABQ9GFW7_9NEOP|nr:hypothetical protein PR048_029177 [Dryococelus australis]
MANEFFFQQDSDPKHTAELVRMWIILNIPHEPQSPKLNSIELLREYLGRLVRQHSITSKDQPKAVLLQEWHAIGATFTGNKHAENNKEGAAAPLERVPRQAYRDSCPLQLLRTTCLELSSQDCSDHRPRLRMCDSGYEDFMDRTSLSIRAAACFRGKIWSLRIFRHHFGLIRYDKMQLPDRSTTVSLATLFRRTGSCVKTENAGRPKKKKIVTTPMVASNFSEALQEFCFQDIPPPQANQTNFRVHQSEEIWTALNIEVLNADEAASELKGGGKREISEKTHRPTTSSGTIPTCENPGWPGRGLNPNRLVLRGSYETRRNELKIAAHLFPSTFPPFSNGARCFAVLTQPLPSAASAGARILPSEAARSCGEPVHRVVTVVLVKPTETNRTTHETSASNIEWYSDKPGWVESSPPIKVNRVRFPEGPLPDFRTWQSCPVDAAGRRVSSGISPPPLHSDAAQYSPRFTLIGSPDPRCQEPLRLLLVDKKTFSISDWRSRSRGCGNNVLKSRSPWSAGGHYGIWIGAPVG